MPNKKQYKFLINPGHSGVIFDYYMTPGKRSPEAPKLGVYEGKYNRELCQVIQWNMVKLNPKTECEIMNPGPVRLSSIAKMKIINEINKRVGNILFTEFHLNASSKKGWSKANGFKIFHSSNASSTTKRMASYLEKHMKAELDGRIRSRGIGILNLKILKDTSCPALLVECGFMTNMEEVEILQSYVTMDLISYAYKKAAMQLNGIRM